MWRKINVTLKGLTPLLMNRVSNEALVKKSRRKFEQLSFEEQAERSAFIDVIDGKRQLYVPAYNIYAMIIRTAKPWKAGHFSLATLLAGTLRIEPEKIPLGTDQYEIDVRSVVIKENRVLKARAKVPNWQINFTILYNEKFLPEGIYETLRKVLEEAGVRSGLLDYRPQHMGWFGTFEVEKFELQE